MSGNIDMLKLENDLKKQRLSYFLKERRNITTISVLLVGEIAGILQGFPANLFVNIAAPTLILELVRAWKSNRYIINEITAATRETEEYKECQKLYDEFIKRVAAFIHDIGYSDSKEAVLYFDVLQTAGILSQNTENIYHNYKYDKIFVSELLGARMASGKCVCRHYASFAADLFNELGMIASPLIVRVEDTENPESEFYNLFGKWTHAAVGIAEGKEKYLYDPTGSVFAGRSNFNFKEKKYSNFTALPIRPNTPEHYLIYPGDKLIMNSKYKEISYAIGALPMQAITEEELDSIRNKVQEKIIQRLDDVSDFHHFNKKLMKELTELEAAISPRSDEPITEWILKKSR